MAAHVEETKPLESSQIRKPFINPLASPRLDSRTNDGSRAVQVRETWKRIRRATRTELLEIPVVCLRFDETFRRTASRDDQAWTKRAWTRHEGKGLTGDGRERADRRSHTGKEVRGAAHRPQGKLCASKPRWIYRTTHSVVRCSRHGAIRHVPKRCRSPAVAVSCRLPLLARKLYRRYGDTFLILNLSFCAHFTSSAKNVLLRDHR